MLLQYKGATQQKLNSSNAAGYTVMNFILKNYWTIETCFILSFTILPLFVMQLPFTKSSSQFKCS
jgi:hypothetical protein